MEQQRAIAFSSCLELAAGSSTVLDPAGVELWPACRLRDDAMAALGIDDLSPLMDGVPELDGRVALDAAAAWLAGRDPAETVLTR